MTDSFEEYSPAWQSESIPRFQWEIIKKERQLISEGRMDEVAPYRAIKEVFELITPSACSGKSVIEVGAGSGFYKRVLESAGIDVKYTALDYSPAFKEFAATVLPDVEYLLGDATDLPLPDNSYDIVLHGCCLIHIYDWKKAVREAARVAKDYVIFHRTPMGNITKEVERRVGEAYGVDCMVNLFRWDAFDQVVRSAGLNAVGAVTVFQSDNQDYGHYSLIYKKVAE